MDKIIKKHLDRKFLEALIRMSNEERCGATPKKLFQKTRDGGLMNSKNSLQKPKKGLATPELGWPPPPMPQNGLYWNLKKFWAP